MALYKLFDFSIESDLPLLTPETDVDPSFRFSLDAGAAPESDFGLDDAREWILTHETGFGEPWLSIALTDGGHLLRFHGLADYRVEPGGGITCVRHPETPAHTVRHLLVAHVVPRILSSRGELVFHGSAVMMGGRAAAFVGKSGSGKSTLVAALAAAGVPVLTDDCLLVRRRNDGFAVAPSYPEIRLWPDTADAVFPGLASFDRGEYYAGKVVLDADSGRISFDETERELGTLVFVGPASAGDDVSLEPKSGVDACIRLMEDMFRLERPAAADLEVEFEALSGLVESAVCYDLGYPRSFEALDETVELVRSALG